MNVDENVLCVPVRRRMVRNNGTEPARRALLFCARQSCNTHIQHSRSKGIHNRVANTPSAPFFSLIEWRKCARTGGVPGIVKGCPVIR